MFFYVDVILSGVDSNTASLSTEDILCQVLIPDMLCATIVLQSDAAATIISLLVIVWLLFEGGVNFFESPQTSTTAG